MNICRLQIRATFFSFNTTYNDFLRCIANIYGFQIRATGSYHSPHFTNTPSPPHLRPFRHSLPHPSLKHAHLAPPPFPRHGNITVSDNFFVAAILAAICSTYSALAPVVAVENPLSGEAGIIREKHHCGKVGLLCMLVHKPTTNKLVSTKVIVGA